MKELPLEMNSVFDTLFLPINQGMISVPTTAHSIGIFGAQMHPALHSFEFPIYVQQHFKPYAQALEDAGFPRQPLENFEAESLDMAFIHVPHNTIEAQALIAHVAIFLKQGGTLICAANNKSGGTRLKKYLAKIGLKSAQELSKNKARVCWGNKESLNMPLAQDHIKAGQMQVFSEENYYSQPGVFGWNKIDKGSKILAEIFTGKLEGTVADFGCGYGYLSLRALGSCDKIRTLYALDADNRAVRACRQNCEPLHKKTHIHYEWADLTQKTALKNIDHVVMNPPFHEQKQADLSIGKSFIQRAYEALARKGTLWMVANTHLPYEDTLKDLFSHIEKPHEGMGFKVFIAHK